MDIRIYSTNKNLKKTAGGFKSKFPKIILADPKDLKKDVKSTEMPSIFYLDVSAFEKNLQKAVKTIQANDLIYYGILDPKDSADDPALYFFSGAVDYIGKKALATAFKKQRFKALVQFLEEYREDYEAADIEIAEKSKKYIVSPNGWKDIKTGTESTFTIIFIEMDDKKEIEQKYGKKNLKVALAVFRNFIERQIYPFEGKIWYWNGYGGIILFPYKGKEIDAVLCAFRLYLFKFIHDIRESHFPNFISFRTVMHLGNLEYVERNTGNVIADSINSIFHIGYKHAKSNSLYLTQEVGELTPPPLKPFIKPSGAFEGRDIFKMMTPVI
ncbi:MAG: hypothetical protein JW969_04530 [Spirochaetales bacterium]|nr:hypothetical protein [Spirochaetales bacterium]